MDAGERGIFMDTKNGGGHGGFSLRSYRPFFRSAESSRVPGKRNYLEVMSVTAANRRIA